jgi:hypothetical protein
MSTEHSAILVIARGRDVDYLTTAVDAGEPAGQWYGAGAEQLGLSGDVNAELIEPVFVDAAFCAPKSVTALALTHKETAESAVLAGARAAIDHLQEVAGCSFVVAQFLQHTSRRAGPALHVHQAISNRVLDGDGTWRRLDSRAIFNHRRAAGAIGEGAMKAHLRTALPGA